MQTRQTWQEAGDFCSMLVNFEVAKRMAPEDIGLEMQNWCLSSSVIIY